MNSERSDSVEFANSRKPEQSDSLAAQDVMEAYQAIQRVKQKIGFVGTPPVLWEAMCQVARDLLALGPEVDAEESRRR